MVTRIKNYIYYYHLHFIDYANYPYRDVYQFVVSKNLSTLRYYANKMVRERDWYLLDFYEIFSYPKHLCLTRYGVHRKEDRHVRFRVYYVPLAMEWKTLDEFLGINEQTAPVALHPNTVQQQLQN